MDQPVEDEEDDQDQEAIHEVERHVTMVSRTDQRQMLTADEHVRDVVMVICVRIRQTVSLAVIVISHLIRCSQHSLYRKAVNEFLMKHRQFL